MMRFTLDLFPDLPEDSTPEEKLEWALSTIRSNPGLAWDIADTDANVIHENVVLPATPPPATFRLIQTEDGETVIECPHCTAHNTIVEVDQAIRFNELIFDERSEGQRPVAHMGPEGDWDFDHWYCESCGTDDLSSPVDFEIREWV